MPDDDSTTTKERLYSGDELRSIPDPSRLTTLASERLESTMRNLVRAEIAHLSDLMEEKLNGVEQRFVALDSRTAEQKKDTKDALDAALAAQKEAVKEQTLSSEKSITKSETTTNEQIKGLGQILTTLSDSLNDKITDLKERLVTQEGRTLGNTEAAITARAVTGDARAHFDSTVGAVAVGVIAISGILAFLASHFH